MLNATAIEGRAVRSLVVIVVMSCVAFGASRAHANDIDKDKITLPPVGVWVGHGDKPDFLLDFKGDKNPSAADMTLGKPPLTKENVKPFIGFSLTRPLDYQN
jgi:hypothetical protein